MDGCLGGGKDIVKNVLRKSPTELWIQTADRGAGIFNTQKDKFIFFKHDINNPVSIKPGIWFTFADAGVSYLNPECQAFFNMPLNLKSCEGTYSENNVTDFGYDVTTGKVYAAANGCNGLFEINPDDSWPT